MLRLIVNIRFVWGTLAAWSYLVWDNVLRGVLKGGRCFWSLEHCIWSSGASDPFSTPECSETKNDGQMTGRVPKTEIKICNHTYKRQRGAESKLRALGKRLGGRTIKKKVRNNLKTPDSNKAG